MVSPKGMHQKRRRFKSQDREPIWKVCENFRCTKGLEGGRKTFDQMRPWQRFCCTACRREENGLVVGFDRLLKKLPQFRVLLTRHIDAQIAKQLEGRLEDQKMEIRKLQKEIERLWRTSPPAVS